MERAPVLWNVKGGESSSSNLVAAESLTATRNEALLLAANFGKGGTGGVRWCGIGTLEKPFVCLEYILDVGRLPGASRKIDVLASKSSLAGVMMMVGVASSWPYR